MRFGELIQLLSQISHIFRPFYLEKRAIPAYLKKFPEGHSKWQFDYSYHKTDIQKHYHPLYLSSRPEVNEHHNSETRLTLKEILLSQKTNRLLIFGDPGSGKTTLLLKTAIELAKSRKPVPLIPIFIRLRDFFRISQKAHVENSQDFLLAEIAKKLQVDYYIWDRRDVQLVVSRRPFVVMFDGLDELNPSDRYFIIEASGAVR